MHHDPPNTAEADGFRTAAERAEFIEHVKRVGRVRRTLDPKTGELREARTEVIEPEARKDLRERLLARLLQ